MKKVDKKPLILSFDPGKFNFAYSLMTLDGSLIRTGMLPAASMTDLKKPDLVTQDIKDFIAKVKSLSKGNKLYLIFERFIPRGSKYGGNLVEITCMKIGIMLASVLANNKVKIVPVLASSWKNFYNKNELWIKNDSVPEHILDAIFIGYYYLMHFQSVDVKKVRQLTRKLEKVNFGWYRFKGQWFYGERSAEHSRGRRNSFGG